MQSCEVAVPDFLHIRQTYMFQTFPDLCDLGSLNIYKKHFARNKHMNAVIKASFFHLQLLTKMKSFCCFRDFESVSCAFISLRL